MSSEKYVMHIIDGSGKCPILGLQSSVISACFTSYTVKHTICKEHNVSNMYTCIYNAYVGNIHNA